VKLEGQADQCGLELLDLIPGGLKFAVVIVRGAPADLAERGQGGLAGIGEGLCRYPSVVEIFACPSRSFTTWRSAPPAKLVESNVPTTLNTPAGAGTLGLSPGLAITGTGLPARGAGPGQERPPVGDCGACRPRLRRGGASVCRGADGRTGGRGNVRLQGVEMHQVQRERLVPGQARDVANDAESQRVPRGCGTGRAPLTGTGR
jgi:hypothetical protein